MLPESHYGPRALNESLNDWNLYQLITGITNGIFLVFLLSVEIKPDSLWCCQVPIKIQKTLDSWKSVCIITRSSQFKISHVAFIFKCISHRTFWVLQPLKFLSRKDGEKKEVSIQLPDFPSYSYGCLLGRKFKRI